MRAVGARVAAAVMVAATVSACAATTTGDGRAAPRRLTDDDRLYLAVVRGTAGRSVAGYADTQLVRAAELMCADLRTSLPAVRGARAEPPVVPGLPGASPSALAAVTGWGGWVYCPELTLPH